MRYVIREYMYILFYYFDKYMLASRQFFCMNLKQFVPRNSVRLLAVVINFGPDIRKKKKKPGPDR
jgi:hypothetical protein